MHPNKVKSRRKKIFKIFLILFAVFAMVVAGLHFWFVKNARTVLIQMVDKKSGGKIKLDLSQLRFNFLTNTLQIREADITSTDSLQAATTYHVKFRKLTLRVNSFWPLILRKQLLLDSLKLHDPQVEIYQWRKDTTSKRAKDEISISSEMGKMYNSMLDVLEDFGIKKIKINNAKVSLINKMKPGSEPVVISNIYLDLLRKKDNPEKRDEFIENEQKVELITTHQQVSLPGGKHKISFSNFKLQLFQKRIEIDSCTISAKATDSSSSYSIFFKKLTLAGVDFDAMDRLNLIRADSVYCENPVFNINFNTLVKSSPNKKKPDLDEIIRDLSGDLDLAYIGVKDAGIKINIYGKKERTLQNTGKDNFEMRGLRIFADSSVPVSVKQFDMLVRDYRLYNADSSVVYAFDSVHFLNKKISLNNFSIATDLSRGRPRNYKDIKIPFFELTGLDWYQLIFEENLAANEALLVNPIINLVTTAKSPRKKKTNLFSSLQTLDDVMTLNRINIIDGKVNMNLGTTAIDLNNVNLALRSNNLLQSTNNGGLGRAVEQLSFRNGKVKIKDITAEMQDVVYTGKNLIHAKKLFVTSNGTTKIKADVTDVYINNLLIDDAEETVIDGIRWATAKVQVRTSGTAKKKGGDGNLLIKNISGKNISLKYISPANEISSFVHTLQVGSMQKKGQSPLEIIGLRVAGNDLLVFGKTLRATISNYNISGNGPSYLSGVKAEKLNDRDSFNFTSPRINFTTDVDALSARNIHITALNVETPVLNINKWNIPDLNKVPAKKSPIINIDQLTLSEPDINITTHRNDSTTRISMPRSPNSSVTASGINLQNGTTNVGRLSVNTTSATIATASGQVMGVENGKMEVELADLQLGKRDGKPFWNTIVNNLYIQKPNKFVVGKNKNTLNLQEIKLGNVNLSSEYVSNADQLFKFNVNAWLRTATGEYIDSAKTLKWFNAEYNSTAKTLTLDSFYYHPTQSLDSFLAKKKFQDDYITFRSGPVNLTDFNLDRYSIDSSFIADKVNITRPIISIFRDKLPPKLVGIYKPLPVKMINSIKLPVSLKSVNVENGYLTYTEKHPKSRAEGTIILARMNARMTNIRNRNHSPDDSLSLTLNTYLMDSSLVNLRLKESYTDSLQGFLMTLRMNPSTFTFLNPVLSPLSNVMITSGTIDSLYLRTIGRDDLALGEMNMFYHDLRIKLVKDGDPTQTTFLTRTISFLANALIIKKNNKGKTGLIYFKRLQDHSFFNYIVKIAMAGMSTSIGVKKNRKVKKMYERELKKRVLPPLEFD